MGQPTDIEVRGDEGVLTFYDRLAEDYDLMTGFEKRFVRERPFFRLLVEKFGITTALDAGCGTGFHSLLLAQLGVTVTAVDISDEMLRHLAAHAKDLHLTVEAHRSTFQNLHTTIHREFDAVFCLGNSLAHLQSPDELLLTLHNFSSLLQPEGILFLQQLNYDRIMAQRDRVQSVKEARGITFVRFYNYQKDHLQFNVLKLDRTRSGVETSLQTVTLHPILKVELAQALSETGFEDIKFFGSISMDEFDPQASRDLVVLARKRQSA
jgi:glycine/sarcosine N-methyltransferase